MGPCQLAVSASEAASSDPLLVGILPSWITTLIDLLLPGIPALFANCFGPKPTATELQESLIADYDGTTYVQALGPVWHQARVKSRRAGNPISIDQAKAIAFHTLNVARTCPPQVMKQALNLSSV